MFDTQQNSKGTRIISEIKLNKLQKVKAVKDTSFPLRTLHT